MLRYYPLHSVLQQAVKQLLVPVLPKFVEAFLEALQSSDEAVTDTGIKTDIMKALTVLLKNVPSHMGAHFKSIVMCIWQLLVNSSELYPSQYDNKFSILFVITISNNKLCFAMQKVLKSNL